MQINQNLQRGLNDFDCNIIYATSRENCRDMSDIFCKWRYNLRKYDIVRFAFFFPLFQKIFTIKSSNKIIHTDVYFLRLKYFPCSLLSLCTCFFNHIVFMSPMNKSISQKSSWPFRLNEFWIIHPQNYRMTIVKIPCYCC